MVRLPDQIDLRPLMADPHAAEMLMLARGQLNRAFRSHGLLPPDPMQPPRSGAGEVAELDDPAAQGLASAAARFGSAFADWSVHMPPAVLQPVLAILGQTHAVLSRQQPSNAAATDAVANAQAFLLDLTVDEDVAADGDAEGAPGGTC
jgi:hypothetical protein